MGANCKVWDDLEAPDYGQLCKPGLKEKDTNALYYNLQVLNHPHLLKASFLYLIIFLPRYFLSFSSCFLPSLSLSPKLLLIKSHWNVYYAIDRSLYAKLWSNWVFCCISLVLRPYIYARPVWLSPVVNLFLWCLIPTQHL